MGIVREFGINARRMKMNKMFETSVNICNEFAVKGLLFN